MAPNIEKKDVPLTEHEGHIRLVAPQASPRQFKIVYFNVLSFTYWHIAGLYGIYLCFTSAKLATIIFNVVLYNIAMLGVTAGVHRLWAHRSYKAKVPLQILLMVFNSLSYQNTILHWARDHRVHHKYSDTDADPHNAARGFFFSHVGWLLVRKHPEAVKRGKALDLSDLETNPILQFQKKYYYVLGGLLTFTLPTLISVYCWQETLNNAFHITMLRFIAGYNGTWLVNSAAHKYGSKPYDKNILSSQNISATLATFGEGFHNYHHVFPYDYRAAELGNNYLNFTTLFIDFFAWIGWAYDLKYASDDLIKRRAKRTGDGTDLWGRLKTDKSGVVEDLEPVQNVWGWGDNDMADEEKKAVLSQK